MKRLKNINLKLVKKHITSPVKVFDLKSYKKISQKKYVGDS